MIDFRLFFVFLFVVVSFSSVFGFFDDVPQNRFLVLSSRDMNWVDENVFVLRSGDTMTGALTLPAGSASAPSLNFTPNTNTGIFHDATFNRVMVTVGGAAKFFVDSGVFEPVGINLDMAGNNINMNNGIINQIGSNSSEFTATGGLDLVQETIRAGLLSFYNNIQIGNASTSSTGSSGIVIGKDSSDNGNDNVLVLGTNVVAGADDCVLLGNGANGCLSSGQSVGVGQTATVDDFSTAVGFEATAGAQATCSGYGCYAFGSQATCSGASCAATGTASVAEGFGTNALGEYSVALGSTDNIVTPNTAAGHYSVAVGFKNYVSGLDSMVFGKNVTASGNGSLLFSPKATVFSDHNTVKFNGYATIDVNGAKTVNQNYVQFTDENKSFFGNSMTYPGFWGVENSLGNLYAPENSDPNWYWNYAASSPILIGQIGDVPIRHYYPSSGSTYVETYPVAQNVFRMRQVVTPVTSDANFVLENFRGSASGNPANVNLRFSSNRNDTLIRTGSLSYLFSSNSFAFNRSLSSTVDVNAARVVRADSSFNIAGTVGLTKTISILCGDSSPGTIDVNGGIITATTC